MFRPLYVGHLQVEIQLTDQLYKMCGRFVWGFGGGGRDPVPPPKLQTKHPHILYS